MPSKKGRGKKRRHVYHRPKERAGLKFTGSHRCPECGKWCYRTRDDAEAAIRQAHPGASGHYYKCESTGQEWWHFTSMTADQVGEIRALRAEDELLDEHEAEQLAWLQFEESDGYGPEEKAS